MGRFTDDILSCCQKEIDNQTYVIDQQEDLQVARKARSKAYFIKAMVLLQDESLNIKSKECIDSMRRDIGDNPSWEEKKMINAAQYYNDSLFELLD